MRSTPASEPGRTSVLMPDLLVVLAVHPLLGGDAGRAEQGQERPRGSGRRRERETEDRRPRARPASRGARSASRRPAPRRPGPSPAPRPRSGPRSARAAGRRRSRLPIGTASSSHLAKTSRISSSRPLRRHQEHALLRLRQHDLVRRHPRLALGHARELDLHAGARRAPASPSTRRRDRPRPCPGCRRRRRSPSPRGTPRGGASR